MALFVRNDFHKFKESNKYLNRLIGYYLVGLTKYYVLLGIDYCYVVLKSN